MTPFKFNETISPEDNINLFYEYLKSIDKEMTGSLRNNVNKLIPLPDGNARTTARQEFNGIISAALLEEKGQEAKDSK